MSLTGINIAVLSGPETAPAAATALPKGYGVRSLSHAVDIICGIDDESLAGPDEEARMYRFLAATRALAANDNGAMAMTTGTDKLQFVKDLDYALKYWFEPARDAVLGQLEEAEEQRNLLRGLTGLGAFPQDPDTILTGLAGLEDNVVAGRWHPALGFQGFFKNIGNKIKKAAQKVGTGVKKAAQGVKQVAQKAAQGVKQVAQKVGTGVKKAAQKVGTAVKKGAQAAWKTIKRFSPLTIAMRNGLLLAMKLNIGKMAERLKWAYATPEQAARMRTSPAVINRAKSALAKIETLFEKMGGKKENIRKAVLKAKKGNLSGFEGMGSVVGMGSLGEPITASAAIAAAIPIIKQVIDLIKGAGLAQPNDKAITDMASAQESANEDAGNTEGGDYAPEQPTQQYEPDFQYQPSPYQYQSENASPIPYGAETSPYADGFTEEQGFEENMELEGLGGIGDGLAFLRDNMQYVAVGAAALGALYLLNKSNQPAPKRRAFGSLAGVKRPAKRVASKSALPVMKLG